MSIIIMYGGREYSQCFVKCVCVSLFFCRLPVMHMKPTSRPGSGVSLDRAKTDCDALEHVCSAHCLETLGSLNIGTDNFLKGWIET